MHRVLSYFRDAPLVSISDHQRAAVATLSLNWQRTVYNGLPTDDVPYPRKDAAADTWRGWPQRDSNPNPCFSLERAARRSHTD